MVAAMPSNVSRSDWLEVRHERIFKPASLRHRHDFHQVSVLLARGADLTWWSEENGLKKLPSRPRNIIVSPANCQHSTDWTGTLDRVIFDLNRDVVSQAAAALGVPDELHCTTIGRDETICNIALTLSQELGSDPLACPLYAETIANFLAIRLLMHFTRPDQDSALSAPPLSQRQISIIDDYIVENLERDISVKQLSALLGFGQLQFSRRLKARTGMSPYQYVTNKRVNRACELLSATKQSIADIGLEVGFGGQSHFSARFKQVVGTTPREYRGIRRENLSMHATHADQVD
jgi:AraC family transcriptional regulator